MSFVKIFMEVELDSYLDQIENGIVSSIHAEDEDYILNVNEEKYVKHLTESHTVASVSLKDEEKYIRETKGNYFDDDFGGSGEVVSRTVIEYHLPFIGDETLLRLKPNPSLMWTKEVQFGRNEIIFGIPVRGDSPEAVTNEADGLIANIKTQIGYQIPQISAFNGQLEQFIKDNLNSRKEEIKKKSSFIASLGVAVKKTENLPKTYAVSTSVVSKKIEPKPEVLTKGYVQEPTISQDVYEDILEIIHDTGRVFETNPSLYKEKDEEGLRDFLLFQLIPRFRLSATGESFNKSGKTDILLKHESKNIFIAECKFWDGKVKYFDGIDQLLSYLTWRDSKVALVIFVKNKVISGILEEIERVTQEHDNYVNLAGKKDESWFNFIFHLPGDKGREVKLAVLVFHTPN